MSAHVTLVKFHQPKLNKIQYGKYKIENFLKTDLSRGMQALLAFDSLSNTSIITILVLQS